MAFLLTSEGNQQPVVLLTATLTSRYVAYCDSGVQRQICHADDCQNDRSGDRGFLPRLHAFGTTFVWVLALNQITHRAHGGVDLRV